MPDAHEPRSWKPLALPVLALSAGAFLFGLELEASPELLAMTTGVSDHDGDGLVDVQETILRTDSLAADSDLDGFSDLEEFARGSDPTLFASVPGPDAVSIAMTGRAKDGVFRAVTALYVAGGDLTGASLTFGVLLGGQLVPLDPMLFFAGANLSVLPAATAGDQIYLLETPFPEPLVMALGSTGIFATYTTPGSAVVTHATALNLQGINGVVAQVVQTSGTPGGSGSLYRPLADDPDIPVTWDPAQVCVQDLTTVGVVGAVLQQQVDDAFCDPIAADSYCPPDCTNLTGQLQELIDPLALIGG